MFRSGLIKSLKPHSMVKRFLGVRRIRNDVPLSAFRNPSTSVKKFCEVPVDHYFTLQAIPGFGVIVT